jgi:phosphatidylserine/phosphatidylglycerophosphate/cardiolipin synthase-like enzyme
VFYDPRSVTLEPGKAAALHAKCVVIDEFDLFVSSANFTEAAQQRNIEVGLRLRDKAVRDANCQSRDRRYHRLATLFLVGHLWVVEQRFVRNSKLIEVERPSLRTLRISVR